MQSIDLEKFNKLYDEISFVLNEEETLVIYTAKTILATRTLGQNPTESLAADICLRAIEILTDAVVNLRH